MTVGTELSGPGHSDQILPSRNPRLEQRDADGDVSVAESFEWQFQGLSGPKSPNLPIEILIVFALFMIL